MKTMAEKWLEYRDLIYPQGVSAVQDRECELAFMAGGITVYTAMLKAGELSDREAARALKRLEAELMSYARRKVVSGRERN